MSVARKFIPLSIVHGEQRRRGFRIECGAPGCRYGESLPFNTIRSYGDDEERLGRMLTSRFEARGWKVGKTPAQDRCFKCAALRPVTASHLKLVESAMKTSTTIPPAAAPAAAPPPAVPPKVAVSKPRELGVAEAFTIREKLEDVYVDRTKGYAPGWTDAKVADALNVPRDWVKQVRVLAYGEGAAGNDDIDQKLAEARSALAEIRSLLSGAERIERDAKALLAAVSPLRSVADRLERDMRSVEASLR